MSFYFNVIDEHIQFLSGLLDKMQFPVARAVMNDGSWCFKAVLHLAAHLASAHISPGPFVFFLWLDPKRGASWHDC